VSGKIGLVDQFVIHMIGPRQPFVAPAAADACAVVGTVPIFKLVAFKAAQHIKDFVCWPAGLDCSISSSATPAATATQKNQGVGLGIELAEQIFAEIFVFDLVIAPVDKQLN